MNNYCLKKKKISMIANRMENRSKFVNSDFNIFSNIRSACYPVVVHKNVFGKKIRMLFQRVSLAGL